MILIKIIIPGNPIDEFGVMLNPVYLDDNGVTIKHQDWGISGDVGVINGKEYTIISEEIFQEFGFRRNLG